MPRTFRVNREAVESAGCKMLMFHITGVIDAPASEELDKAFAAALSDGGHAFVLDFSNVEYISSSALRMLLKLRRAALDAGGCIAVAGLRREIRENVFDSLGFSRLIDVYGSVKEAVAAIAEKYAEGQGGKPART
jgi:anti-sigma B factor antagonist